MGAEVVRADLERSVTLETAFAGAYGVFSVQNYWEKGIGYEGEVRQGRAVADAAKAAGVDHVVQSTMAAARSFAGVRHFESKRVIESYVRQLKLPLTLIGTVYFMDNLLDPHMGGKLTFPMLAGTLGKRTPFQLLAVDDIGMVVTEVFKRPGHFIGDRIDLAGDTLTVGEMRATYQRVTGRQPKAYGIPTWVMKLFNREFAEQLLWHKQVGWELGMDGLSYPGLTTFEGFLKRHDPLGL